MAFLVNESLRDMVGGLENGDYCHGSLSKMCYFTGFCKIDRKVKISFLFSCFHVVAIFSAITPSNC